MSKLKWWHKVALYTVFGWAVEVFFTGIFSAIGGDIAATGQTYLWMFPVWGFGGLVFEKVALFLKNGKARLWLRVFVYTSGLMMVEYASGLAITVFTGTVPWDYSLDTQYHLDGLVRYDYLPFWMVCGIVMECFVFFVERLRLRK